MPKDSSFKFDAAGWLFWLILFFVFLAPGIFLTRMIVYKSTSWMITAVAGAVFAAVVAGVISWAVNSLIQYRKKKQRIADRKKAKKQK